MLLWLFLWRLVFWLYWRSRKKLGLFFVIPRLSPRQHRDPVRHVRIPPRLRLCHLSPGTQFHSADGANDEAEEAFNLQTSRRSESEIDEDVERRELIHRSSSAVTFVFLYFIICYKSTAEH